MGSLLPQVLESHYLFFKANKDDLDFLIVRQALAGAYKEEFLEIIRLEIEELENIILGL